MRRSEKTAFLNLLTLFVDTFQKSFINTKRKIPESLYEIRDFHLACPGGFDFSAKKLGRL